MSEDPGSFVPDVARWDPWTPAEVAERLEAVDARWYVLAGWALDLFLGRITREHEDIEIGVAEGDFGAVRAALGDFEVWVVGDGRALPETSASLASYRQTWVRERETGIWRLDIIRERWDDHTWIFRRDERIRLSASELIARADDGIPYVQPEVVLLFKARSPRPKDELDFELALPSLDERRRCWLHDALSLVHPGHPWLDALARL